MESSEQIPVNNSEIINQRVNEAVDTLKDVFQIENLSTIELFHLRKITEDVLPHFENSKNTIDSGFPFDREVATRFLIELYGIHPDYLNKHSETDEDMETFFEYIRRKREQAHLI